MKITLSDPLDQQLCAVLAHEMARCQDALDSYAHIHRDIRLIRRHNARVHPSKTAPTFRLPSIIQEIVVDLEAALELFAAIEDDLRE